MLIVPSAVSSRYNNLILSCLPRTGVWVAGRAQRVVEVARGNSWVQRAERCSPRRRVFEVRLTTTLFFSESSVCCRTNMNNNFGHRNNELCYYPAHGSYASSMTKSVEVWLESRRPWSRRASAARRLRPRGLCFDGVL